MAKTTFEDIKKALWAGANTFRDNIDAANYKDWNARCPGLKHVFVAGEAVVTDSVHDGRLLGQKLLRGW